MTNSCRAQRLIAISLCVTAFFAMASFVVGVWFRSQVIFFDGLYSLIGVGTTSMSLYAMRFIQQDDWKHFPFGKDIIEPLVVTVNYFIILLLVVASLSNAVITIFRGGQEIMLGPGMVYAGLGTLVCFVMYGFLAREDKRLGSRFVAVEAVQWYMDGLVSAGILAGFGVAMVMDRVPALSYLVPYVDPAMVIIVAAYFMRVPLLEIKNSLREILAMPPQETIRQQMEQVVEDAAHKYGIADYFLRLAKIGPKLLVEIDFIISDKSKVQTIYEQDQVREVVSSALAGIGYEQWLTVSFTADRRWAE